MRLHCNRRDITPPYPNHFPRPPTLTQTLIDLVAGIFGENTSTRFTRLSSTLTSLRTITSTETPLPAYFLPEMKHHFLHAPRLRK